MPAGRSVVPSHGHDTQPGEGGLRSLVQSRHTRGLLLSYFLAPRTVNLCYEEVINKFLQENQVGHEKRKQKARSLLTKSLSHRTMLLKELDDLSKEMETAEDKKVRKS